MEVHAPPPSEPLLVPYAASGDALPRAVAHLASLQHAAGYWEGEMVWNSMLLSQWVIVQIISGRPIPDDCKRRAIMAWDSLQRTFSAHPSHDRRIARLARLAAKEAKR